jgi:hypothetical protein
MDHFAVAEQAGSTRPGPASELPAAVGTGSASVTAGERPTSSASTTLISLGGAARDRLRRVIQPGPIGWAAFLACSWTWCIGMFLPVLFLRDYGGWGWLLFAFPNVVGAAAMGWMLRDPDASRTLQQAHVSACRAFSLVTLAFHAFFILALAPRLLGNEISGLTGILVLPFMLVLRGRGRGRRRATVVSAVVLALSVLAMLTVLAWNGLPSYPAPAKERVDLFWLAPVVFFGFLLDPYLDLTFHRARQSTTRAGGRTAFGLGFGVFFLLMIVFTAIYAPPLIDALRSGRPLSPRHDVFAAVLMVHIALQSAFTIAAHADALRESRRPGEPIADSDADAGPGTRLILGVIAAILLALPLRVIQNRFPAYHGLSSGEVIYRLFLAFYGLVFPAYVWLFAVPRRLRGGGRAITAGPTRGQVIYFLAVLVLAAPMYWMSFIEGRMAWAVPGLLLVLVSRFLLPKPESGSATPQAGLSGGISVP